MKHTLQREKMLTALKGNGWVCVEEFSKLFIVDYRRRLVDIQRLGYELESQRCTLHSYHKGGSKMWRLMKEPQKQVFYVKHPITGEKITTEEYAAL
jgi:hypothetical protein